ncbi:exodeoxyribonuclease VII large subunit [Coprobacter tertius]|uniref:Exodeoxyribonuclease 7 large subunit n=1 Tax=Coprobacter tertius TaxID=2944915 RepID=A0ABT1MFD5_9BACT|nr:exodeoxyribonuclease VII large subunit [Coprobacter tertius]MCP9610764.1 exodeoxyribonuclease VII large subunit [Coprobacter tertius]
MERNELSLFELNILLKRAVNDSFPERYWIRAEISELHENKMSGHCYLEFIEKSPGTGQLIAKARGMIWASTYSLLKSFFEQECGMQFVPGIKVLVEVSLDIHELYGYSLTVHDIDPSYTLGDMARHRAEILQKLTDEGVIDMNKDLEWPVLPQRIAVISSGTAAGYGDFMHQLQYNSYKYCFYPVLFQATMQGEQAQNSVISALERIYTRIDDFDGVAILRGGGATSELSCFDSYLLALHVAQFPLPVITGIGHDRDTTVLDSVANVSVKTPTAAAEWLISKAEDADRKRIRLQEILVQDIRSKIISEKQKLERMSRFVPVSVQQRLIQEKVRCQRLQTDTVRFSEVLLSGTKVRLQHMSHIFLQAVKDRIGDENSRLFLFRERLRSEIPFFLDKEKKRLEMISGTIEYSSPLRLLEKGYTLTLKEGKIVRRVSDLTVGDSIITLFPDGEIQSDISDIKQSKIK